MNSEICFYTPGPVPKCIDIARMNEQGQPVTYFAGETLDELRQRYPLAEVITLDEFLTMKENALRTDPVRIEEEHYWDALECLPPLDYTIKRGGESFKMVERFSGRMTNIYAKVGNTYWMMMDIDTLPHEEIIAKVQAAVTA